MRVIFFFICLIFSSAGYSQSDKSDSKMAPVITGVLSPASSDTVSRSIFEHNIVITLSDSSWKLEGFVMSYATKDNRWYSQQFKGNTANIHFKAEYWICTKEAVALFVEEIRVTNGILHYKLPSIHKYVALEN